MRTFDISEFSSVRSLQNEIDLQKKVSEFWPCKIVHYGSTENNKVFYEFSKVQLEDTNVILLIEYEPRFKKYEIICESNQHGKFKDLQFEELKTDIPEPQKIGVLTAKKIQAWVEYHEQVNQILQQRNHISSVKVDNFLRLFNQCSLKQTILESNLNQRTFSGSIVSNGIQFTFKISQGHISQDIKLHYSIEKNLATFIKLQKNELVQNSK